MPSPSDSFEQAVEAFYRLNVGVVGTGADRHERPHKPVLLALAASECCHFGGWKPLFRFQKTLLLPVRIKNR